MSRNPHARRFAAVPGTHRPRVERCFPRDPELNTISGVRREPCIFCGSRLTTHLPGCPNEFGF